ncbi:aminotransferase class V-fold PLP-dependent enzyme [Lentzea sp. NBRC 102530]|uniref:pyridoxal phosphate-dependent decarboxylase family protein n=1 Tax=Lentzea sp. NBRC 102530 TaxID=3032201 RepID=UPI00255699F2|nr:aminotransferase class V-fold PLP-dependent enzyme [Lentzea sp. NBRC 102530]
MDLQHWLNEALANHEKWTADYGTFTPHSSLQVDPTLFGSALAELQDRLRDNYPFFHPRYAGQMLKPPHPAAVVGYLSAMLINPNNHALDGGPATATMEREVVADLARMFGYTGPHLGHLTSSGTIANLEALFVARSLHPAQGIAYSSEAHYTHSRMCGVLNMEGHSVPADAHGRMDLDALEALLKTGKIGTVVVTPGTTALGAVEPVHEVRALTRRYGARVHVDGAYGGFFTLLAGTDLAPEPWRAIADCDSVVVDPHKHGLQPYGCGAVLFKDPEVGRFYLHDSPYTYFTSDELHLGEISLECSRAGAAAAGLWLTLRLLPLTRDGLGEVLAAGRRAAVRWASMIRDSEALELYQEPELDIVTYFPRTDPRALSAIDAASHRVMDTGMHAPEDPIFLSVARASKDAFAARHPDITADADGARVLRSVLMKPESEDYLDTLHARVLSLL